MQRSLRISCCDIGFGILFSGCNMIQLLNTPSTAEYNTNAAKGLVYVLSMRICPILLVIVMGS